MYLINTTTLELENFIGDGIPKYAILSHRWGSASDEPVFKDALKKRMDRTKPGVQKVINACQIAKDTYGMDYVWIDTICIDKKSSADLSEAINSMFTWYKDSEVCIAFLNDLGPVCSDEEFANSQWFTRAWTLQELLAPSKVDFFNSTWQLIGSKFREARLLEQITKIPAEALYHSDSLSQFDFTEKMTWAGGRVATRIEDIAYSLLGLFNVNMPLLYGEGDNAFVRLQEEIIRNAHALSFLAWEIDKPTPQLLAKNPGAFFPISLPITRNDGLKAFSWINIGLQMDAHLFRYTINNYGIVLVEDYQGSSLILVLHRLEGHDNVFYKVGVKLMQLPAETMYRRASITVLRGNREQTRLIQLGSLQLSDPTTELRMTCVFGEGMVCQSFADRYSDRRFSGIQRTATNVWESRFRDLPRWTASILYCESFNGSTVRILFAFDFHWALCFFIETGGSHYLTSSMLLLDKLWEMSQEPGEVRNTNSFSGSINGSMWHEDGKVSYFFRVSEHGLGSGPSPSELGLGDCNMVVQFHHASRYHWQAKFSLFSRSAPFVGILAN